ncbi:CysB family HTH-type transcriptional regulator [Hyphomicrobium facile]|uniref:LysR family transcriptional regulator, cys regulon transcriptional activator n=1 Tax=Hyphomicrobium facile TaxID=51670 RepID=A0A1I7MW67_9HYPH|nr:CysB family HTH-type transcriptional regulator [Hyphomicrobium facile]SFV26643.1 LysR family transcriptional regulator, cys regulon transcriptional activator [Hyphomicrobium facile]
MNFQQLRIIRETLRRNFNLTEVANALYTSQSGVSKHIKDLEDELGVELFVRRGKRLLGLTEPGKELALIVDRILLDTANIKRLADQFAGSDRGEILIATTHTQARYALPGPIAAFRKEFPNVHLVLHQGTPREIAAMLNDGTADIGIATEALEDTAEHVTFPFYSWHHGVVVPKGHPLESQTPVTLENIADWPIITYHEGFTGRPAIDAAFASANLAPDIVMVALDADVIKTYVEVGLGIGIVASMSYDESRDKGLTLLDTTHLFPKSTSRIALRRGRFLRGFAYRFIELCAPALNEKVIKDGIASPSD